MFKRPSWPSLAAMDHGIRGSEEENESKISSELLSFCIRYFKMNGKAREYPNYSLLQMYRYKVSVSLKMSWSVSCNKESASTPVTCSRVNFSFLPFESEIIHKFS